MSLPSASQVFNRDYVVDHYRTFDWLHDKEKRILHDYFTDVQGKKVLDIGCGAGRMSKVLHDLGMQVTGIDVSSSLIDVAKEKYPDIDFRVMDATKMPFKPSSFDIIISPLSSLDYIRPYARRLEVLQHIYQLLQPGGLFIYSSHNAACILTRRPSRLKNLLYNILTLRVLTWYRKNFDPVVGWHVLFHQQPFRQVKTLQRLGFTEIKIYSQFTKKFDIVFKDNWPYYVARKPLS